MLIFLYSCSKEQGESINTFCGLKNLITKSSYDFIFIGDQGSGNSNQQNVANAIESFCTSNGCDAVFLLGDNFYDAGVNSLNDSNWNTKFFNIYQNINLPFYAVLGNHDYNYNKYSLSDYQVKKTNYQSKWIMPGHIWRLKNNLITILGIDSNKMSLNFPDIDQIHKDCFGEDLIQRNSTWKITLGHHPFMSNGEHGSAYRANTYFYNRYKNLICNNTDLYFAGHDHTLELIGPTSSCSEHFIISGAGGSDLYNIINIDGNIFSAKTFGFTHLKVTNLNLIIDFYNTSNTKLFTKTINR